jgi:hypothetical protein
MGYLLAYLEFSPKEYQVMFKHLISILIIAVLSGCSATLAPPYQKDRKPEDRDQYSGVEGMVQQQKDQNYLITKELRDNCFKAKIDLAVAENNEQDIAKQEDIIESTCI